MSTVSSGAKVSGTDDKLDLKSSERHDVGGVRSAGFSSDKANNQESDVPVKTKKVKKSKRRFFDGMVDTAGYNCVVM
jgi:hypothetical protein